MWMIPSAHVCAARRKQCRQEQTNLALSIDLGGEQCQPRRGSGAVFRDEDRQLRDMEGKLFSGRG